MATARAGPMPGLFYSSAWMLWLRIPGYAIDSAQHGAGHQRVPPERPGRSSEPMAIVSNSASDSDAMPWAIAFFARAIIFP